MTFEAIVIRRAEIYDIENIWRLLHADCRCWKSEEIQNHLEQFLVIQQQEKILGVLYGNLTPGKELIEWVVIHPMYPEKPLREILTQSLISTQKKLHNSRIEHENGAFKACFEN